MKQVYSAIHPTEAHLVKGLLHFYGIDCEVRGENLFSARGEIPLTTETAPSIWIVNNDQFDEARAVIKEYEQSNNNNFAVDSVWICSSCGEECEIQFMQCWNCGKYQ